MTVIFALCSALVAQDISAEHIYETASASVLTLTVQRSRGETAIGTAFLAFKKGVAVTAWHVVKGAKSVTARFSDGREVEIAGVIDKDPTLDIALIKVDSGNRPVLRLADLDPKVGSKAFVIGAPRGSEFSISDGIISQTPKFGDSKLYQFTCPVSQGNSGGPLLNGAGNVMGVVSWQLRDAQNLNFAVPVSFLKKLDQDGKAVALKTEPGSTSLPTGTVTEISDELLAGVLKASGLSAESADDGTGLTTFLIDFDGTKGSLFQYSKGAPTGPTVNLSLSSGFQVDKACSLKQLNTFNQMHRFVRCYLGEDGVVYIENDLDTEHGVGVDSLNRFLNGFKDILAQFETEVLEKPVKLSSKSAFAQGSVEDKDLVEVFKQIGVTCKTEDDGSGKTRFSFLVNGLEVSLHQFGSGSQGPSTSSLALSLALDFKQPADLNLANKFNESSRYAKVFVDEEGDPYLVSDLDVQGQVTSASIKAFIDRFIKTVPGFVRFFSQS